MSTPGENRSDEIVEVRVRRAPKWPVFFGIGAGVGVVAALILASIGSFAESPATNVSYPFGQVFGFLLLWTAPIGVAVFGLLALALDRAGSRRERVVRVDHETVSE